MRRVWWLFLALTACGTYGPVAPPVEPPPVVNPPPVVPPPVVPAPADLTATLDRIVVGSDLAEVITQLGAPTVSPANDGGPPTARWFFTFGADRYMVYAVFTNGKIVRKGSARIEVVK